MALGTTAPGKLRVVAMTGIAPALWGGTYVLFTETLPTTHPLSVGAWRSLVGGLLLLAVLRPPRPALARWRSLATLALLNVGLFSALLFVAASRVTGGIAATLTATQPLVAAIAAWPLLGHRPGARALAFASLGIAGVALLVGAPGAALDPIGVAAALGAAVAMGTGTVLMKRWRGLGTPSAIAAWQLIGGGALLTPVAFALEGMPPVPTAENLLGFALLGTLGTAWAFMLWTRGARALGEDAAFLGLLSPLVATALGALLLGERLVGLQLVGAPLVLLAAAAGALSVRTPASACPTGTPPTTGEPS